jgi:hypothetical protein
MASRRRGQRVMRLLEIAKRRCGGSEKIPCVVLDALIA